MLLFIVGDQFTSILKKLNKDSSAKDEELSFEEDKLCDDLSFDKKSKCFRRMLINQSPALMPLKSTPVKD